MTVTDATRAGHKAKYDQAKPKAPPGPWIRQGLCFGKWDDGFYPPSRHHVPARIKAMCAACPVAAECLEYAQTSPFEDGVWAGTSERERQRMRTRARLSADGRLIA